MKTLTRALVLLILVAAPSVRADDLSEGHITGNLPEYHAADLAAAPVTRSNVFHSERFWPYQAALTRPWKSVSAGSLGVLIRLESDEVARLDFGRDGLLEVPIDATDVIQRANEIRLGTAEKIAPNFMFAILPRLLDSRDKIVRGYPAEDAMKRRLFLAVFADPWRKEFGSFVKELAPLSALPDVLVIFFPQSRRPDSQVAGQLRAMGWPVPFLYAHLSEPYTRTLLEKGTRPPAVTLQTGEGRLLYSGRLGSQSVAALRTAIEASTPAGE